MSILASEARRESHIPQKVTGSYETPNRTLEPNSGPPRVQYMFLITEPYLQPYNYFLKQL